MPNRKTGQEVPCCICGTPTYKTKAYLARGYNRITCTKPDCKSQKFLGKHNPFWGKKHNEESLKRIKAGRALNPPQNTGPPKGYKHSPEAKKKITEALERRWRENRDVMLSYSKSKPKPIEELRYRRNFTPAQRREWKVSHCAWCPSTEKLVLDHIIPVMCGGKNERRNAQTLCQPCNLWKMGHVDRQLFLAGLGGQEGHI